MPVPPPPEDFSWLPGQPDAGPPVPQSDFRRAQPCILRESATDESEDAWPAEPEDEGDDRRNVVSRIAEWKAALREDFESWLDTLDEIPAELDEDQEPDDNPDLVTVFGDLASLALESRKSNRRTADAFAEWNTVLAGFQDDLKRLRERERVLLENRPPSDPVPAPLAAFLVDFHDRLTRLVQAQSRMPDARIGLFGDAGAWKTAWQNQHSALEIALSHLQAFLKEQGFERIRALGQPLDPTRMAVIETRLAPGVTPHTVIGETAPGWLLGTRVLRPAQVVVAIPPPESDS